VSAVGRRGVALLGLAAVLVAGCTDATTALPRCDGGQRLAIVAQSVPGAAYVPCVEALPAGWRASAFRVDDHSTRIELRSDRADRPMVVLLAAACRRGGSTPVEARADGVRTYLRVDAISPRYSGRFFDVFAGGCVTTTFDLARGAHVALVDELRRAVELYSRQQLSQELEADLGVTLDP
jgi:hypothetical protein